jgi:hypothetical protein
MSKQQAYVFWIIWFAFLQSAFVIHFILGGGFPEGDNVAEPMAAWLWLICIVPIVLATAVRWLVIPKLKEQPKMLVAMIIGLALCEQPIFFSLFLIGSDYPQYQIVILMLSVVSLIQFAPSYATPGYKGS